MDNSLSAKFRTDKYSNIILLILLFTPFTALKKMNIGISEILCIYLFFSVFLKTKFQISIKKKNEFIFTKFWIVFILLSILGIIYNYVVLEHVSGLLTSMIFDLASYTFVLMTCLSIETIIYNYGDMNIENILKRAFIYSGITFILLFILSKFTNQVFGVSLLYNSYFVPLAINPHHTAMYIAPLPFIGLMYFSKVNTRKKIWVLLLVIATAYLGVQTGSSKLILGLLFGGLLFLIWSIFKKIKGKRRKILGLIFIILISLLIGILSLNIIIPYVANLFVELDSAGARQTIYTVGFEKSLKSFIVGYGPGAHSEINGGYIDAHQTLLTILLQSGIFGLLYFINLAFRLIKNYSQNAYIMGAIGPIAVYALGGDIMRRLPIWIFLMLFYYYMRNDSFRKSK